MSEYRQYPRYAVQQTVYMNLMDKKISGDVENLSCAGAYVKIDGNFQREVHGIEIGIDVEIIFDTSKQIIKGKILRCTDEEPDTFLAIYFLENYNFDLKS